MRRHLCLLPVVVAALTLGLPSAATAAPPKTFLGIVSEDAFDGTPEYRRAAFAGQKAAGFGLVRQVFDWKRLEPEPGVYDLSSTDALVLDAARQGLKVMPVLFGETTATSSRPPNNRSRGTFPPRNAATFAGFAAAVGRRYGRSGTLWVDNPTVPRQPVEAYQIWNEPNLPRYWLPRPDPAAYVSLLAVARSALRAVDSRAQIVTAGIPASNQGVKLERYVGEMYRVGGRRHFDVLALHPYSATTSELLARVRRARRALDTGGDKRKGIWITELGYATQGPASRYRVGSAGQARLLREAVVQLGRRRDALRIRGIVYFNWRDSRPFPGGKDFWGLHTGLRDLQGRAKPALGVLRRALASVR